MIADGKDLVKQDSTGTIISEQGPNTVRVETVRPKELYDAAYLDLSRKNYDLALSGFLEYLSRFPQNGLAANAQYWIGEIFYIRGDFEKALEEFLEVESKYPNERKVPAALLKAGYCYLRLQNKERARRAFENIIEKYPQTEEANLARERLKPM